jgi:hypothetical protein
MVAKTRRITGNGQPQTANRELQTANGELRTVNGSPPRPDIDRMFPVKHADRIEGGGIGNQDAVLVH